MNGLSPDAFKEWEKSIHFKSYRSLTDDVIAEIQASEGTSNFNVLLQKYSDLVYLSEDSLVCPLIEGQVYRNITNEQGVFYAGTVKNMFNKGHLSAINIETNQPVAIGQQTRGTISNVLVTYPTKKKHRELGGKYSVLTYTKVYEVVGGGVPLAGLYADIVVWGHANGRGYSTECFVDDVTVRVPGQFSDITYPGTRSSSRDCSSFTYTVGLSLGGMTGVTYESPLCLHYRARTRGTGNVGVPYNFYHGKYYEAANEDPNNPNCDKHFAITYNK